jgi:hypothetical protein
VPAAGADKGDGYVEPAAASVAAMESAGPARGDRAEVSHHRRPDDGTKTRKIDDGNKTCKLDDGTKKRKIDEHLKTGGANEALYAVPQAPMPSFAALLVVLNSPSRNGQSF